MISRQTCLSLGGPAEFQFVLTLETSLHCSRCIAAATDATADFDWKTLRFKDSARWIGLLFFVYIQDSATYQLHPTTLFSIPSLYQHISTSTIRAFEVVIFALVLASLFWPPRWPGLLHTLKLAAKPPRDEDDDSHSGYNLETRFEWIMNAFDSWILDDDWSF